jgi:Na+/phosphate symporter
MNDLCSLGNYYSPIYIEIYENTNKKLDKLEDKVNQILLTNSKLINKCNRQIDKYISKISEDSLITYLSNTEIKPIDEYSNIIDTYITSITDSINNILKPVKYHKLINIDFNSEEYSYKKEHSFNTIDNIMKRLDIQSLFQSINVKKKYIRIKKKLIKKALDDNDILNHVDLISNNPEIKFYHLIMNTCKYKEYFTNMYTTRHVKIHMEHELKDVFTFNGITCQKFLEIFLDDNKIKIDCENIEHKMIIKKLIKNHINKKYDIFE